MIMWLVSPPDQKNEPVERREDEQGQEKRKEGREERWKKNKGGL